MWLGRTLRSLLWDFQKQSQRFENLLLQLHHCFTINSSTGCRVLCAAGLDESCWTNLKPTESRWHRIFVGLEWIPGGFCNSTSLLCPPCPAGSSGPQPGNSPSYPPVPRSWKLVTGHACWYDLSQSHSPGRGWCQLSLPPVGYKKTICNLKNTTQKNHSNYVTCYGL